MGGISAERGVSLRSGAAVFNALSALNYNTVAIDVGPDICEALRREKIEMAFLALHGGYGENGAIQGLLEVMGIPYTGSGVLASALAMDKEASKKIFLYHKIQVPSFGVISREYVVCSQASGTKDYGLRTMDFELPWVIKPATEGSSIGVNIVSDKSLLDSAIEEALRLSERVIVEKYIEGKEIHVGILNNRILGSVEVRPKLKFYSYEAKYTPGLTEYILPPDMQPDVIRKTEERALSAYKALGCKGAARVDLIVDNEDVSYVLEVNTIPGMTETSLLPKIADMAGLGFPSLIEEILKDAITDKRSEGTLK